MKRFLAAVLFFWLGFLSPALAVNPNEVLADPVLETRARALSAELRCMVCQNQSIDDSNADLAKDLRLLVRERLKAGDSDAEVIDYLVSRYGEFVLLKPRLSAHTILLWGMPVFLVLIGITVLVIQLRRGLRAAPAELTEDEQKRLDELLRK
jgi:cytochrome c-type biogenesis protein CcmH